MEVDEQKTGGMTVLRNDMLNHLVNNSEIIFKSQQLGEPELTREEKFKIAEECLNQKPLTFLTRFNQYMDESHFEYFRRTFPQYDYEVSFYLKEVFSKKSEIVVKNRRLEALKRLAIEGDYFTEDEMKKRNPLLYEQLVGKYLTEEEKKDKNSFSHTINKDEGYKLSSLLLEQYERDIMADLQKQQEDAEEVIETDTDDDNDGFSQENEKDDRVLHLWGESKSSCNYIDVGEKISVEEKKLLFEEFRSHMFRDFIGGKERDFDYSKVDSNADYDDLDELDRDAQDTYFNTDSPEQIEMEISSANEKPIYSNTTDNLDMKIKHIDSTEDKPIESNSIGTDGQLNDSDPLDDFMCQLNEQQMQSDLNLKMKNTVI